ncbi:CitMHS family transporter [Aerococcus sanguinicola]
MLTVLSYLMIIIFMFVIIRKKMSPFTALIGIPLIFALIAAVAGLFPVPNPEVEDAFINNPSLFERITSLGEFAVDGVGQTATTGIMLLFAILYFAIMLNAGMFDPITEKMIRFAKGDPVKILFATAFISMVVSLNGDGTTTTLIVCTAFIPIYKKLNLRMMNLAVLIILMNTIMNLLPWGGPTARAISVLSLNDQEVIRALAPGMVISAIYVLGLSIFLGVREHKRVGIQELTEKDIQALTAAKSDEEQAMKRPKLFWVNLIMTITLIFFLVSGWFPALFLFLTGTVLALIINYPDLKQQKNRIQENAGDAVQVVILVFAAGIFMGLFTGTGMADALAQSLTTIIPDSWGRAWGLITALLSAPGTFFLSNDAFYYGVLPVLYQTGTQYGYTALEIGVASLLGQAFHLLSPLVAFIYLLFNLTGVDMGEWQKESGKWALGIFIIFIAVAAITGAAPIIK